MHHFIVASQSIYIAIFHKIFQSIYIAIFHTIFLFQSCVASPATIEIVTVFAATSSLIPFVRGVLPPTFLLSRSRRSTKTLFFSPKKEIKCFNVLAIIIERGMTLSLNPGTFKCQLCEYLTFKSLPFVF